MLKKYEENLKRGTLGDYMEMSFGKNTGIKIKKGEHGFTAMPKSGWKGCIFDGNCTEKSYLDSLPVGEGASEEEAKAYLHRSILMRYQNHYSAFHDGRDSTMDEIASYPVALLHSYDTAVRAAQEDQSKRG
ncbi:uncharacterized protein FOMMEDRAFT_149432 [Fomitiporia mediterranea MF3/22]|uniref:uncharacterized protein n=1 Tax=Fomitiporia mediterranea (strain MF3/22) TaxID=694068 RepID=UPI00044073A6|nr:uncharacterized protein FOMMEDRAFT_149432 [Fomitiporia mediterranea MF3/22]EJC97979.1 hypothetical protein FOMMEDRAFT_149432 [Fomitiporia mediterranea MF3/22]